MANPLTMRTRVSRKIFLDDTGEGGKPERPTYRCEIHVYPRATGGFVAVSANLTGIEGIGASEAEAIVNVKQALIAAIPLHLREDGRVNWQNPPTEVGPGGTVKVVFPSL